MYFDTEEAMGLDLWLEDPTKRASKAEGLSRAQNSLSSSYLLGAREVAQKQVKTDRATEAQFLQEWLLLCMEVMVIIYMRVLKRDYLIKLADPLGLEFLKF